MLFLNIKLREALDNPVAASVFPTITMATMLLAGYVKPYCADCANILWHIGIAVASVSAPVTGNLMIGQYAFWFGLVIFAAPASLLLAGYMVSFPEKNPAIVYALLTFSIFFWLVGIFYFAKTFRGAFMPSHSAFTFPLVISALAVKLSAGFTGFP